MAGTFVTAKESVVGLDFLLFIIFLCVTATAPAAAAEPMHKVWNLFPYWPNGEKPRSDLKEAESQGGWLPTGRRFN